MRTSLRYLISLPVSAGVLALALIWTPLVANSQGSGPKETKGQKSTLKQAVDLGPEIDGMTGRQLRMRVLTIEPGGHNRMHSHKDRPAVVYFLQGTDTITFGDGSVKVFRAGDTSFANGKTMHWHQNDGKEPVVLIAVDILHKKK